MSQAIASPTSRPGSSPSRSITSPPSRTGPRSSRSPADRRRPSADTRSPTATPTEPANPTTRSRIGPAAAARRRTDSSDQVPSVDPPTRIRSAPSRRSTIRPASDPDNRRAVALSANPPVAQAMTARRRTGSASTVATWARADNRPSSSRPANSGNTRHNRSISSRRLNPAVGSSTSSRRNNSPRIRSPDTIPSRSASDRAASTRPSAGVRPYLAWNRAARSIRSGSSPKDSSGDRGVRRIRESKSPRPSNGSCSVVGSATSTAIAFTVKSRRPRSSWRSVEKRTTGLRESSGYDSALCVVISMAWSPTRSPTVPNRSPCSHTTSATPSTSSRIRSGVASVVRSWSGMWSAPMRRSRTSPPTR